MDLSKIIVSDVSLVTTVDSKKGRSATMHNRACYGLSFTTDGQITYTHNGNTFVSDKYNVVILPKGQSYHIHGDKDGLFPVINFDCEGFLCDTITVLPFENTGALVKKFENLRNCSIRKNNRLLLIGLFYDMLYTISDACSGASNPLSDAIEYIENNISSDITNEDLAKSCHLSEEYFRKQFKKTYGISPKQYIIDMRLTMAKQMLSEGVFKINVISEKCGFSNPYHFCRLFKDKVGLTPSEYMKQNKINKL